MNTLDKFLMTFINNINVLIAKNVSDISFRDFQKTFNYSVNKHCYAGMDTNFFGLGPQTAIHVRALSC